MTIAAALLLLATSGNLLPIESLDGYHVYKALKRRNK